MKTDKTNEWTRREFTVGSVLAMLSGVAITVSGCGDSNSSTAPTPAPAPAPPAGGANVTGVVSANHGHIAVVTGAQLTAAMAVNLDIMGNANHSHTVSLSAGEVSQIAGGNRVQKTSTNTSGHTHTVTFN